MSAPRTRTVTVNEVVRMARRAFIALGTGPGCEREAADAVAWLETRGLAGLAALHADLATLRDSAAAPVRVLREEALVLELDAGGGSAVMAGPAALDWLAAAGAGATVALAGARSPVWWLPALAARAHGLAAWVQVHGQDGQPLLRARSDGVGGLCVQCCRSPQELAGLPVGASAGHGAPPGAQGRAVVLELDQAGLDARHRGALDAGVAVPVGLWEPLLAVSREVLVPESQSSRERGAGGGDDNA